MPGLAVVPVDPVLTHAGRKNRMFDVEEEDAVLLQRLKHLPENLLQIFNIVQRQIGNHTVPGIRRVFIFPDTADAVRDSRTAVPLPIIFI